MEVIRIFWFIPFHALARDIFILPDSMLRKSIDREKEISYGAATESRMQIRGGCSGGSGATTIRSEN